jgi:FkbM family methyltransferase
MTMGTRRLVLALSQRTVRALACRSLPRNLMNAAYRCQGLRDMRRDHARYAKLFRVGDAPAQAGVWTIRFVGRTIRLPLRPERMWLDWDSALSILGHDVDIKATYASLLASPLRPSVFVDIGANYGTHSLLFMAHEIRTLAFEPNMDCQQYFREACALNGFEPRLHAVALGRQRQIVTLVWPGRETWLGTITAPAGQWGADSLTRNVQQCLLDDYRSELGTGTVLIKIDTEGSDLRVLQGATETLRCLRPQVILESRQGEDRDELYTFLTAANYVLARLPWTGASVSSLGIQEFRDASSTNFLALPRTQFR